MATKLQRVLTWLTNGGRTSASQARADLGVDAAGTAASLVTAEATARSDGDTAVAAFSIQRGNHTGTQASSTITTSATARILGRTTTGAGAVEELSAAQAKTLLSITTSDVSGLGNSATLNVGITAGTVADGAGARSWGTPGEILRAGKGYQFCPERVSVTELPFGTSVPAEFPLGSEINLVAGGVVNTTLFNWYASLPQKVAGSYPVNDTVWPHPDGNLIMDHFGYRLNMEFLLDGSGFAIRGVGTTPTQVFVDGLPLSRPGNRNSTGNSGNFFGLLYQFETSKKRLIRVVTNNVGRVYYPAGGSVTKPAATVRPRILLVGDSYVEGAGMGPWSVLGGLDSMVEWITGCEVWNNGLGSTGFNNSGIRYNFKDRITTVLSQGVTFNYIVFCGSTNDGTANITANAQYCIDQVVALQPTAKIFLFGPFQNGVTSSSGITNSQSILKALATANGVRYIASPLDESWLTANNTGLIISGDGLHPSPDGHSYYGERLASAILNAIYAP